MDAAARNGNFYIVKYLMEIGCPYTLKTIETASQKGEMCIAEYLKEQHYRELDQHFD